MLNAGEIEEKESKCGGVTRMEMGIFQALRSCLSLSSWYYEKVGMHLLVYASGLYSRVVNMSLNSGAYSIVVEVD